MVVAKRQRKENAPQNGTKVNLRTRVRISGETNSPPGWPSLHTADSEGEDKWIKAGSQLWKLFSIISLRVMVTTCSNLSRLGMLRKVEVYYSCLQLEQHTIR